MALEIPEQAAEYFRIDDSPEIIDHLQLFDREFLHQSPTQSFISAYAANDLGKVSTLVPFPPVFPCVLFGWLASFAWASCSFTILPPSIRR